MKISVIIPTYNRSYCLERAIESVLSQSYKNFDLWIVDDGSTDETQELLKKYCDHPQVHLLKTENRGVSAARNYAAKLSDGQWLSFLDSDDEWLKDKLQKQVDFIKAHPSIRLVHGEEIWIRNGKRVNQKKVHKKSGGMIFKRALGLCLISPSAVSLKRDLYFEHGGFDEDFIVCEDYDLWLKVTHKEEIGFIEDPIINKYGGHEDQLSAKYFAMDFYRVKSMIQLAANYKLDSEDYLALLEMVQRKCEILLKGYEKHQNMEHYPKVSDWHSWAIGELKEREPSN